MHISDIDKAIVEGLRQFGVLRDVDGHQLNQRDGAIVVACSDGDQLHDIFANHAALQSARQNPRIHLLGGHGGALKIPEKSPILKPGRTTDLDLIDEIFEAQDLKGITTVVLYTHTPCGKAYGVDLNFLQVIALQMAAKSRLKALAAESSRVIKVACFAHVHHADGRRRTYYICKEAWKRFQPAEDDGDRDSAEVA